MSKALPKGGSALSFAQGYERPANAGPAPSLKWSWCMVIQRRSQFDNAMTGNAGLNYASWQLSRRGWHVLPTIRNARGSDLIVTNADETVFFGVQSKALSKRAAIGLGLTLDGLRSDWWIITVNANTDEPVCYVLSLNDVRQIASRDEGGKRQYWLESKDYDRDKFREAWERMESSLSPAHDADKRI